MELEGAKIHITGIVQGVGFRPFVYGLATRLGLKGWVRNTSAGVDIQVDGAPQALQDFVGALQSQAPMLARIDELKVEIQPQHGYTLFEIIHSQADAQDFQPLSPDVSICADCLRELFDPHDRRYRYPFINCTNCGPRFTIIQDIPYDRPKTTMAGFPMCADCSAEYHEPQDRRFHAQPVACPRCGPQVWLEPAREPLPVAQGDAAIRQARQWLLAGKIIAVKGLGGFHLACDATNSEAVERLRLCKMRVDKPFALMMAEISQVEGHCLLSPMERRLIESRQRPIVVVRRNPESAIAAHVAPGQQTIGVMLPYTPLHYLLFASPDLPPLRFDMPPLVMTSGNLSEEPICTDNDIARQRLAELADAFLLHDRPIHIRCDDSVVRFFPPLRREMPGKENSGLYPIRRARGYAPEALRLPLQDGQVLATGAELKNTFCLTRQGYAFLSHHIGDLENYETLQAFESGVEHYERLFRICPQAIAYDLHPDYLATRYALERAGRENLPLVGVQHHHAHIAAGMADAGLDGIRPVLGVAFDGTGYGEDGAIWGGEFLLADYQNYQRLAHLRYAPLPGGDRAVREPWRMALAWLREAGIPWSEHLPPVQHAATLQKGGLDPLALLDRQLQGGLNTPLTSSVGRLFDAVAALIGVRQVINYEAQAAIEMEALIEGRENRFYELEYHQDILDPVPMFHQIVEDMRNQVPLSWITTRFHAGLAFCVARVCSELRRLHGIDEVVLSGGVWQNTFLLSQTVLALQAEGFEVYVHRRVPANDGGVSLGQAMVALAKLV